MGEYPELIKRFGRRKVRRLAKRIKKETGLAPAYVELLVRLETENGPKST